jgi:hypothetical protein
MDISIPAPEEIRVAKHDMLEWTESYQKINQLQEALHELRAFPGYERFLVPPAFQDICDNISGGYKYRFACSEQRLLRHYFTWRFKHFAASSSTSKIEHAEIVGYGINTYRGHYYLSRFRRVLLSENEEGLCDRRKIKLRL